MNGIAAVNQEEAAYVAAEFLSSLDNLPNEVQHLLAEIRHKDNRAQEIQQEINKDTTRYIRHALKGSAAAAAAAASKDSSSSSSTPGKANANGKDTKDGVKDSANGTPPASATPTTKESKDALIPARVAENYNTLDKLAAERVQLATRLTDLLTRVNARLEHDLTRVVALSGETMPPGMVQEQEVVRGGYVVGTVPVVAAASAAVAGTGMGAGAAFPGAGTSGLGLALGMAGMGPHIGGAGTPTLALGPPHVSSVDKVMESLRGAAAVAAVGESMSTATAAMAGSREQARDASAVKRRKLNTTASSSRAHTPQARSRLAQQVHPSPPPGRGAHHHHLAGRGGRGAAGRAAARPLGMDDMDADGDEDGAGADDDEDGADADGDADEDMGDDDSGDTEDKGLYCYCQKMSYGEMVGCDNDNCPIQWFHLDCVGLNKPLPETWYCDECLRSLGAGGGVGGGGSGGRKGRRKLQ